MSRILVVDDDPIGRGLIATKLARMPAKVVEASDGQEAWEKLVAAPFDLAFVDLNMPNVDGFELIRCIRSFPRTRDLPIVVVTAHTDEGSISRALAAGATSFLTKPIAWYTFGAHIENLLRLTRNARCYRDQFLQAKAISRAKDQIISGLCSDVSESAEKLADQLRRADLRPIAADGSLSQTGMTQKLSRALRKAEGIAASAQSARKVLSGLGDVVVVEDEPVSLDRIIYSATTCLETDAARAGVRLEIEQTAREIIVACHHGAIALALQKLIENAITCSPQGQSVRISASSYPDGLVAIEVSDSGPGMMPDFVAAMLTPFSVDEIDAGGKLGTGWPIAKAIAEAHNGKLEIHSMAGHGTSALLILPHERFVSAERREPDESIRAAG